VQKRSAKLKYKSETAQSAKSKRVYYSAYSKYITDLRGCQEKLREICVFARICGEVAWFRVPPPEVPV